MLRRFATAGAALTLIAALIGLSAPSASAHAALVSSDPVEGVTLTTPPDRVTLTFNEDMADLGAEIEITCEQGGDHAVGDTVVEGTTVWRGFDFADMPGGFTVTWRAVSSDGHTVSGSYGFRVEPDGATTSTPQASGAGAPMPTATSASTGGEANLIVPSAASQAPDVVPPTAPPASSTASGWAGWAAAGVIAIAAAIALVMQRAHYRRVEALTNRRDASES